MLPFSRASKLKNFLFLLLSQDSDGGFDLVDCQSSAKIVVDEKSLQGNLVFLCSQDFHRLGYVPSDPTRSNIFNRVELPGDSSQQ